MNGINELAAFIAGLRREDVAAPLLDKLRLHVVDILGAWTAATATAEGRALIRFHGEGWPGGTEQSLADALMLHCALARLSEIDDIHLASMTTPGSIVIPAALLVAAALADADDVVPAIVGGYEAMIRLGEAINGPQVLYRGIWPTYFATPFATAAVAARLLRLDERQTAHALALALTMAAPSVGQHHAVTTARWLAVGNAARNGLTAALAARAGFTADVDVLRTRLFPDIYAIEPALAAITEGLGTRFALAAVSFKPWCAARQTMAATQALRELVGEEIATAEIDKITAAVLPPHFKMINHGVKAGDRAAYVTSLPYQMALAVLQPERMLDLSPPREPPSETLLAFMARIELVADESLRADYPAAWPARVTATTADGRHEKLVRHVPGDPARPLGETELKQKFQRLVVPVTDEAAAARLWQAGSTATRTIASLREATKTMRELASGSAVPAN